MHRCDSFRGNPHGARHLYGGATVHLATWLGAHATLDETSHGTPVCPQTLATWIFVWNALARSPSLPRVYPMAMTEVAMTEVPMVEAEVPIGEVPMLASIVAVARPGVARAVWRVQCNRPGAARRPAAAAHPHAPAVVAVSRWVPVVLAQPPLSRWL